MGETEVRFSLEAMEEMQAAICNFIHGRCKTPAFRPGM